MFEVSKGKVDSYICDYFHLTTECHNIRIRQATSGNFFQPQIRTNNKSLFITNAGIQFWNNIPSNIKSVASKKTFSCLFKQLLLQEYTSKYKMILSPFSLFFFTIDLVCSYLLNVHLYFYPYH